MAKKVLIVDDQQVLRSLLVKFITKAGLEPLEAEDGQSAVALYQAVRPAVVLSDIMMPRMDGLTLLNEIKKINRNAVVILMTGYGNEDILLKALRGGAANYFKKPFNFHEIIEVVRQLIKLQTETDFSELHSPHLLQEHKEFRFTAAEAEIYPIINQIVLHLNGVLSPPEIFNLKVGLEEMLKNAVEHGNLGISAGEKNSTLEKGTFGELLRERVADPRLGGKRVLVCSAVTREELRVTIEDEGIGFDWRALPSLQAESLLHYSGRGIFLTRIYFDEVTYNERGNQVMLVKRLRSPL